MNSGGGGGNPRFSRSSTPIFYFFTFFFSDAIKLSLFDLGTSDEFPSGEIFGEGSALPLDFLFELLHRQRRSKQREGKQGVMASL